MDSLVNSEIFINNKIILIKHVKGAQENSKLWS